MIYKHFSLLLVVLAACAYAYPYALHATEINYGAVKDQRGDTLLLEYKSPAGTQYFTCTLTGTCKHRGTTSPALFPTLLGTKTYEKSADGRLAIRAFPMGTVTYYFLYDIRGNKAKKIALVPYVKNGAKVYFARNNNAVVFRNGNTFTRYDITSKKVSNVTLAQDLAFLQISPHASYVTGYNYGTLRHELWRFADSTMVQGPTAMQSYFEFSEDESRVAFLDDVQGFRTLFSMRASDLGKSTTPSRIALTKPNTETEDYLFVGATLYFMANVDGPLEWDLFAHDGARTTRIDTDVSYGDYLKRVRSTKGSLLAYLKTEGKNTNVHLVNPDLGTITRLKAVTDSPASSEITRTVKKYGGRTGVLLSPSKPARSPALFIWMHGGPQRQVAKGYHPYLSYAVYDEMLERFAEGGHYVYKIDYTGSTGYGADFKKGLDMKIGDVEMKDIRNAVKDIDGDIDVDKVYLIGNSYGGYMALRGIVDTPKTLDGVVSINGVSDWYGLIQQIPSSPFKDLFNGVPDTHNLDAYLQASVFTGMEKLTKDDQVLVIWGEQDGTVPVWQSTKYVEYAKTKGVNVSTLSFPTEEHIIRARNNLDAMCKKVTSFLGVKGVSCAL